VESLYEEDADDDMDEESEKWFSRQSPRRSRPVLGWRMPAASLESQLASSNAGETHPEARPHL